MSGSILSNANAIQIVNDVTLTSVNATQGLTVGDLIYPSNDGVAGQVIVTDGQGHLTLGSVPGVGNVVGAGVSIVNQVPLISNTTTTGIKPSVVSVDGFGNITTPGVVSSAGGNLVSATGTSVVNQVPVFNNATASGLQSSLVTISPAGNITTPGTISSASGNLVVGAGTSVVNQVPIFTNTSSSAVAPSPVSINLLGNITTPGTITSAAGQLVAGGAASVPNQLPVISNATTSTVVPTPASVDPGTGNISTPGTVSASMMIVGGQPLVVGSGVSTPNQLPVISNATTSAVAPSLASVQPITGNFMTPGTVQAGGVKYTNTDGTSGQVLTTNGSGVTSFQTVSGTGNVIGAGVSAVNQLPIINNTSTSAIAPSTVTVSPVSGNLSTPGTVSAGGAISTPAAVSAGSITTPGTLTAGNIVTAGSVTAGSVTTGGGPLVSGAGASVVGQLPTIADATTSSLQPSLASVAPVSGNITTPGTVTAGAVTYPKVDGVAGQVLTTNGAGVATFQTVAGTGNVVGSGVSVVNQLPVISNTSTTGIAPSTVTVNPVSGNLVTPGSVTAGSVTTSGAVTAAGTVTGGTLASTGAITAAGSISTPGTITAGTIVSGAGTLVAGGAVSSINQLPVISNVTTSAVVPSPVTVNPISGNVATPGTISAASVTTTGGGPLTVGAVTYPATDGVAGQVLTTNGAGVSSFQTVAGTGNVVGSGVSIVNQLPVISNTSTTGIAPSVATLNPGTGNFSTPGSVTAGTLASTGAITAAGAISTPGTITAGTLASTGVITATGSVTAGTLASTGAITAGGSISTPGTITAGTIVSGAGTLVAGGAVSTVHQVPVINNTTTSTVVPSAVTIVPLSGNVVTPGTITAASMTTTGGGPLTVGAVTYPATDGTVGQALVTNGAGVTSFQTVSGAGNVVGSGVSVVNQVPRISNTSTTAMVPSSVSIDGSGNITTPGTISSGAGALVAGSGVSVVGQVPTISNTSTSAMVPSLLTVAPVTGNTQTPGTVTMGALTYPKIDGTNGQVLMTNGSGVLSLQTASGSGNVIGTGVSVVNQVPRISNVSTTALVPSSVSIDGSGNISTPGTITSIGNIVTSGSISAGTFISGSTFAKLMSYPPISTGGQQALITNNNRVMRNGNSPTDANMLGASPCRRFMDVIVDQSAGVLTGVITQINNNEYNMAFVTSTGQVWVGGNNSTGQLGIPAATDTQYDHRRIRQVLGMPPMIAIYAHRDAQTNITYAAISATGTVYTWGFNGHGAVGDGTFVNRTSPFLVPMPGGATVKILPSGIPNFTAGTDNSITAFFAFVSTTGQLIVWGGNASGQLGNGANADVTAPVVIAGITCLNTGGINGDAPSVMGSVHDQRGYLRIIKSNGTTWASGSNPRSGLADNTTVDKNVFVQDFMGDTDVDRLMFSSTDLGGWISTGNQLRVCGNNSQGAIGNGTLVPATVMSRIIPVFAGQNNVRSAIGVSTSGVANIFALCYDGTVWCAGSDSNGQTAQGTVGQLNYATFVKIQFPEPVQVFAMNVQPISGGTLVVHFNCTNGTLWSCGNASNGTTGIEYAYGDSMPSIQKVRLF